MEHRSQEPLPSASEARVRPERDGQAGGRPKKASTKDNTPQLAIIKPGGSNGVFSGRWSSIQLTGPVSEWEEPILAEVLGNW